MTGPPVYVVATLVAMVQPALGLVLNASLWILWIRLCYRTAHETTQERHAAQHECATVCRDSALRSSNPGAHCTSTSSTCW
jgi:hypothetical protein